VNQNVIDALKLLDLFAGEEVELSLSEIHKKTSMSKSKVFRLLSSLVESKFLRKVKYTEHDIRYQLGLKLMELGHLVSERLEIRQAALPHMRAVCNEIQEIVHLAVLDGNNAVYIEKVESDQPIRLYTQIGRTLPLYVGSGPKLLLAYMDHHKQEEILNNLIMNPFTKNTITSLTKLKKEIKRIREKGYSVSYGEQNLDTTGVSVPIRDFNREVVGVLTASGPSIRFDSKRRDTIYLALEQAAMRISSELGYKTT
jgi:DNA-binding IclR family transcriptional regulator